MDVADQALLRECLSQKEEALSAFYGRFASPLYALIYAILHDAKDAAEVLQEVFLEIWRREATYDPQHGTVFTWAVKIARSRALKKLRNRPRHSQPAPATGGGDQLTVPPEEPSDLREEREAVRAALGHIPQVQRAALELAFFSGLSRAEMAAKLGVPGTVLKAQIRCGLLSLRNALTQSSTIGS